MLVAQSRFVGAIDAISRRRSIRAFHSKEVSDEIVSDILRQASRAPSGQNMQPWHVHFVTGETRDRLCGEVMHAADLNQRSDEYTYFPDRIEEPYLSRRRKVGFDLFALYGIERGDMVGRKKALLRNFSLFGAPVALFFTMRRDWGYGAWLDIGMFMMNVMTAARAYGLETCPQQAWCEYGAAVRRVLDVPLDHVIISGMALGYADDEARANLLVTERAEPALFTTRYR